MEFLKESEEIIDNFEKIGNKSEIKALKNYFVELISVLMLSEESRPDFFDFNTSLLEEIKENVVGDEEKEKLFLETLLEEYRIGTKYKDAVNKALNIIDDLDIAI